MEAFVDKFMGIWSLVSVVNEINGMKSEPFGPDPIGSLILTSSGRFIMVFMQSNIPKFAVNNRLKGTREEYQTIAEGVFSMFGSYKIINEQDGRVDLFVDGCSFPNWIGTNQERIYSIYDDLLVGTIPLGHENGTNTITWKRAM